MLKLLVRPSHERQIQSLKFKNHDKVQEFIVAAQYEHKDGKPVLTKQGHYVPSRSPVYDWYQIQGMA